MESAANQAARAYPAVFFAMGLTTHALAPSRRSARMLRSRARIISTESLGTLIFKASAFARARFRIMRRSDAASVQTKSLPRQLLLVQRRRAPTTQSLNWLKSCSTTLLWRYARRVSDGCDSSPSEWQRRRHIRLPAGRPDRCVPSACCRPCPN